RLGIRGDGRVVVELVSAEQVEGVRASAQIVREVRLERVSGVRPGGDERLTVGGRPQRVVLGIVGAAYAVAPVGAEVELQRQVRQQVEVGGDVTEDATRGPVVLDLLGNGDRVADG